MSYAERTRVPINKTKIDIEAVLSKYGADRFAYSAEPKRAVVAFQMQQRCIRFELPLNDGTSDKSEQLRRQAWRALFLCIKAKLESVVSQIETFEEAFLAHVVLDDGKTVYEHVEPRLAQIRESGRVVPLLPAPGSTS